MSSRRTPIYTEDGRFACYFDGRDLVKTAEEGQHMLRKPPAWAWDISVIENGLNMGASGLIVETRDTHKRYVTSMDVFLDHKGELNRGHNTQWFLTLKHWKTSEAQQLRLI